MLLLATREFIKRKIKAFRNALHISGRSRTIVIQMFNLCLSHLIIPYEENLIYDTVEINFYILMEDFCPFLSKYALILIHVYLLYRISSRTLPLLVVTEIYGLGFSAFMLSFCHGCVLPDEEFPGRRHSCPLLQWENTGCITIGLFQESPTSKGLLSIAIPFHHGSLLMYLAMIFWFIHSAPGVLPDSRELQAGLLSLGVHTAAQRSDREAAGSYCRVPVSGQQAAQCLVACQPPPAFTALYVCHVPVRLFEGLFSQHPAQYWYQKWPMWSIHSLKSNLVRFMSREALIISLPLIKL